MNGMKNETDAINFLFGFSPKVMAEAKERRIQQEARRDASNFRCAIPDWTGQGGMVNFWINADGSWECEDSRINETDLRRGMEIVSRQK